MFDIKQPIATQRAKNIRGEFEKKTPNGFATVTCRISYIGLTVKQTKE